MGALTIVAIFLTAAAPAQPTTSGRDCWAAHPHGSFSGRISMDEVAGRTVIYEQVGSRGSSRIIQKRFGDLRLCLIADDVGDRERQILPSQWLGVASRFVMEARRGGAVHRLEGESGGRISWHVNGRERSVDAHAQRWRDRMLTALDTTWELSELRGRVSSLRGQISSIRGQESSLRGEISSLRGQVSSMRGRISSIRGHESALRGAISSERGAISSLSSGRRSASNAERARVTDSISRHEATIARIEQDIRAYDADGKAAAIEAQIRAFDLEGKVTSVERRIAALDVDGKVAAIEKQITALDADRRGRELEKRREAELAELDAAMIAVR